MTADLVPSDGGEGQWPTADDSARLWELIREQRHDAHPMSINVSLICPDRLTADRLAAHFNDDGFTSIEVTDDTEPDESQDRWRVTGSTPVSPLTRERLDRLHTWIADAGRLFACTAWSLGAR